jgi:hypothetical protein
MLLSMPHVVLVAGREQVAAFRRRRHRRAKKSEILRPFFSAVTLELLEASIDAHSGAAALSCA